MSDRPPHLTAMLLPGRIAVIGATDSPGSVGRALLENLRSFSGSVYLVNPKRASVLGGKAFPAIGVARLIKARELRSGISHSDRRRVAGSRAGHGHAEIPRRRRSRGKAGRIRGRILPDNKTMLAVSREIGFTLQTRPEDNEWEAMIDLG